jgi:methionyl-tRNA formyltransferase
MSPVAAAILNGDVFTGVSVMVLETGVDTGPVLASAAVSIADSDTTGMLTAKLARVGAALLLDVLPRWQRGELVPRPQDGSLASHTREIEKEAGTIDWTRPAAQLWRQVRAYQPWPGSSTRWHGKQVKIIEAVPVDMPADRPGRVIPLEGRAAFGVETGSGVLGVLRVQIEGKRAMSAEEFLRGQRQFIGAALPAD